MPFRSRRAALGLLVAVLAVAGCDTNNPGRFLDDLDGAYTVVQLTFDPSAAAVQDADVLARLTADGRALEVFGGDGSAQLTSRLDGESGRTLTRMTATASRGRVTFTAVDPADETELARLLLPRSFTLTYDVNASRPNSLTGSIGRTDVDLARFDPQAYSGLPPVSGTLFVRLDRVVN